MEAGLQTKHTQERRRRADPWLWGGMEQHLSSNQSVPRRNVLLYNIPLFMKVMRSWELLHLYSYGSFCISEVIFLSKVSIFLSGQHSNRSKIWVSSLTNKLNINVFLATPIWTEITPFVVEKLSNTQRLVECSINSTPICVNRFTLVLTPSPTL